VKFQFIQAHSREYPIALMCRALEVSESGYHAWTKRKVSKRAQEDQVLAEQIGHIFQANRGVYGSPRIHAELQEQGRRCGRKRIARLMQERGISAQRKRRRVRTTDSNHSNPVAPNLLNREFSASAPNTKWVTDITAIETAEGDLYLAGVVDIYSRMVVGWAMGNWRDEQLVTDALMMAVIRRRPHPGLLHHSDRGSQYTSQGYLALLRSYDVEVSMSKKADCYDNALMESFFGTVKEECVYRHTFRTRSEARQTIFEYLEVFYNRTRRHSALGQVSPVIYEQKAIEEAKTDS
jgi:putative transposase